MARLLLVDKQFQRALDACDAALRIDPDDPEVHRWRDWVRFSSFHAPKRRSRHAMPTFARDVHRPMFSGCVGSPRPGAMTSSVRSKTIR